MTVRIMVKLRNKNENENKDDDDARDSYDTLTIPLCCYATVYMIIKINVVCCVGRVEIQIEI